MEVDNFSTSDVISQKVANLLSTSYGDSSLRQALYALDSRLHENTNESRRSLRPSIEAEIIRSSGNILKEFSKTVNKLQALGDSVEELNQSYQKMDALVETAKRGSSQMIREASALQVQAEQVNGKLLLLEAFETKFVVSDNQVEILTSTALPIDDEFYEILGKVKQIHDDCSVLFAQDDIGSDPATESGGATNTGSQLMLSMAGYLDRAYEKLAYFAQQQFRQTLSGQRNMRVNKPLRRCLITLTERPSLFDGALSVLCDIRQSSLGQEFTRALTQEASTSNKPIDFFAYDIIRYIGDIMAWIHSAIVGEKENLEALLESDSATGDRLQEGFESEPWERKIQIGELVEDGVDKITSSLVRPLKVRVERSLLAQTRVTVIYQVYNILGFYQSTFAKNFTNLSSRKDSPAAILLALDQLKETCLRQFNRVLESKIQNIKQNKLDTTPIKSDLQPPDFLFDATADLKSVLVNYETSTAFSTSLAAISQPNNGDTDRDLKQIVQDMVEPYLECCSRIASDLPDNDAEVFMINCYDTFKITLFLFTFTYFKAEQIDLRIEELLSALVEAQVRTFMEKSGLTDVDINDKNSVALCSAKLDEFLPTCRMESSMQLQSLSSPSAATYITNKATEQFTEKFGQFKTRLLEKYGDESDQLFPRTLEEVKILIDVD